MSKKKDPLVTCYEAAKIMEVATRTVYTAVERGDLAVADEMLKNGERFSLIRLSSVKAWCPRKPGFQGATRD